MSEKSLRRLLLNETGLSFLQWQQKFQLIVAVRALREGMGVQEVAGLVGYNSTAAFNTMFKKAMGVSPGRFSSSTSRSSWDQADRASAMSEEPAWFWLYRASIRRSLEFVAG